MCDVPVCPFSLALISIVLIWCSFIICIGLDCRPAVPGSGRTFYGLLCLDTQVSGSLTRSYQSIYEHPYSPGISDPHPPPQNPPRIAASPAYCPSPSPGERRRAAAAARGTADGTTWVYSARHWRPKGTDEQLKLSGHVEDMCGSILITVARWATLGDFL